MVRPAAEGRFAVVAGGRRLAQANALLADGVSDGEYPVPCRIQPDAEDAHELSLAENVTAARRDRPSGGRAVRGARASRRPLDRGLSAALPSSPHPRGGSPCPTSRPRRRPPPRPPAPHPMDPRRGEGLSPAFAAYLCWLLDLPPMHARQDTASRRGRGTAGQTQIFCSFHQWILASGPGFGIPFESIPSRPRAVRRGPIGARRCSARRGENDGQCGRPGATRCDPFL